MRVVDGGDSWDYQYDAGERNRGRKDTAISQTPEGGRVIQRAKKDDNEKVKYDFRQRAYQLAEFVSTSIDAHEIKKK